MVFLIKAKWINWSILLFVFNTLEICKTETCSVTNVYGNCYCHKEKVTTMESVEKYDPYRYIHYQENQEVELYSFVNCEGVNENSFLSSEICPENNCKYITFLNSEITVLHYNYFKSISNIKEIYMNNSGIEIIQTGAFSGIQLQIIQLEENIIGKISRGCFNSLSTLKILDLHSNKIEEVEEESLLGLTSLETLNLNQNKLTTLPLKVFDTLESLKRLDLSQNLLKLIQFDLSELAALETLRLNHNELKTIEKSLNETRLISINLRDNKINFLNASSFPDSLVSLDISRNNISEMSSEVFDNLNKLSHLAINKNNIQNFHIELFNNLRSLTQLDLSENKVSDLKTGVFSTLENLALLNISYMGLNTLDVHTLIPLTQLKSLDIRNNKLIDFDSNVFLHFNNLEKIYLGENHLSCPIVASIFSQSKLRKFIVIYDEDFSKENIKGLTCYKNKKNSSIETGSQSTSEDWNIHKKEIIENITYALRIDLKKLLNDSFKKMSDETHAMYEDELRNMISENDYVKKLFVNLTQSINYTKNSKYEKLAELERNLLKLISNNSNKIISANLSNTDEIEYIFDSINEMKLLVLMSFLLFFCYICIKIFTRFCQNSNKRYKDFDVPQEMPIIRNLSEDHLTKT